MAASVRSSVPAEAVLKALLCSERLLVSFSPPALTVVVPVNVLAPESVMTPEPSLTRWPSAEASAMMPAKMLPPLSTPMARFA